MHKPWDAKICEFIYHVNDIVEYLYHFSPLQWNQGPPEYDILELVYFVLHCKWQKHLLVQGFDSANKSLNNLTEFCDKIETVD